MISEGSEFENNGNVNYDMVDITGRHPWCHYSS
jgi:hypothetical protein